MTKKPSGTAGRPFGGNSGHSIGLGLTRDRAAGAHQAVAADEDSELDPNFAWYRYPVNRTEGKVS